MSYQRLVPNNLHDGQVFNDTHVQHIEDGIVTNETSIGEINLGYTRKNTIARTFYDDEPFSVGEYVWYENVLYRFTVDHEGAWSDQDVEPVLLTEEIGSTQNHNVNTLVTSNNLKPLTFWGEGGKDTTASISIKADKNTVSINGSKTAGTSFYNYSWTTNGVKKVSGDDVVNATLINANAVLRAKHTYKITMRVVSGTYTPGANNSADFRMYIMPNGGSVATARFIKGVALAAGDEYTLTRTYDEDMMIGIGMYLPTGTGTFSNLVLEYNIIEIPENQKATEAHHALDLVDFAQKDDISIATASGLTAVRKGNRITFNGTCTAGSGNLARFRMGGTLQTVASGTPTAAQNAAAYGAVLNPTHVYRIVIKHISGTITGGESLMYFCTPYTSGTTSVPAHYSVESEHCKVREGITGVSGMVLWASIYNGSVCTDATFEVTIEDETIKSESDYSALYAKVRADIALAVAGSPNSSDEYGVQFIKGTIGGGGSVYKIGNQAIVSGTNTGTTSRVMRFSGDTFYCSSSSTPVTSNTLGYHDLMPGRTYKLKMRVLSGTIDYVNTTSSRNNRLMACIYHYDTGTTNNYDNSIFFTGKLSELINAAKYVEASTYSASATYYKRTVDSNSNVNFTAVDVSVEETMIATKEYASGDYIAVGTALYKATASIAEEAELVVGTNIAVPDDLYTDAKGSAYPLTFTRVCSFTDKVRIGFCMYMSGQQRWNNLTIDWSVEDVTEPTLQYTSATPNIQASAGVRYICSATAVTQLTFTPCDKGICSVRFTAGSNMVLNLPQTVKMPEWWNGVEAGRTYEISIEDGVYGVVTSWA